LELNNDKWVKEIWHQNSRQCELSLQDNCKHKSLSEINNLGAFSWSKGLLGKS